MPSMIGRRDFLASSGAVVAAGVTGAVLAEAADEPAGKAGWPHQGLVDAARACVADGQAGLAHCLGLNATRLGEFATACRDICDDCEKECRKHADKHAVCKACADSCALFVAEAKRLTVA